MVGPKRLFLAAVLLAALCSPATAVAGIGKISISQVSAVLPQIDVFLRVEDEQGQPRTDIATTNLAVSVDGTALSVEGSKVPGAERGVAYTVLLDISKSVNRGLFSKIRSELETFITGLQDKDRVAILLFGERTQVLVPFTKDFRGVVGALADVRPNDNRTLLNFALNEALDLNKNHDPDLPRQRAILLITDGKDEGSGITLDDIARKAASVSVPVFVLGYTAVDLKHLNTLRRIPELTGGFHVRADDARNSAYERLRAELANTMHFIGKGSQTSGASLHTVQAVLTDGGKHFSAERTTAFLHAEKTGWTLSSPLVWGSGLAALLLLPGVVFWLVRRRASKSAPLPDPLPMPVDDEFHTDDGYTATRMDTQTIPMPGPDATSVTLFSPNIEISVLQGGELIGSYQVCVLERRLTVGSANSDLVLQDDSLGAPHCAIQMHDNYVVAVPLSRNSPLLHNGIPVQDRVVLSDRDLLELGSSALRVRLLNASD